MVRKDIEKMEILEKSCSEEYSVAMCICICICICVVTYMRWRTNAFSLSLLYIRIKKLVLKFVAFQYLQFQEQSFIKNLCIYYFVTGMNSSFLMRSYRYLRCMT